MIKLKNTDVYGFEAAIRGMRNPWNSWEKSDTIYGLGEDFLVDMKIGDNDLALMKKLVSAGTDHSKFMRMINVTVDITAPLYWWKEFDTYKVGTVRNSCSTMHKIAAEKFTLNDFSHEHLDENCFSEEVFNEVIRVLNFHRKLYLKTNDKQYWHQMIQLLPSSYNQRATVQMNYAVLQNIYHSRRNHRLDEWKDFCRWIETLPYSELIAGEETARNGWAKMGS